MQIRPPYLARGLLAAVLLHPLSAATLEVTGVRYATTDQPVINTAFRFTPDGDYFEFQDLLVEDPSAPLGFRAIDTINLPGVFFDTGASGNLLSFTTANTIGLAPLTFDPDGDGPQPEGPVVFNDIGIGGTEQFTVSEPLYIGLADVTPGVDAFDANAPRQTYGPVNFQIAEPPAVDPILGLPTETEFDVLGMSFFLGKTVVMDFRPSNNIVAIQNGLPGNPDEVSGAMRTYIYDQGTPFSPGTLDTDPGIVPTDIQIQLSYGNFADFTSVEPAGAPFPTLAHNPFIGTAPTNDTGDVPPLETPGLTLTQGTKTTTGSFLFDTGGSVSLLSSARAAELGVTLVNGDIFIDGVRAPAADTFSVEIQGVGGGPSEIVGVYLDSAVIPTLAGDPNDPDNPNHIHIDRAPFFIADITLPDPSDPDDLSKAITLDGVLGMNYLAPSAEVERLALGIVQLPIPVNLTQSPYDFAVFDETTGILGLKLTIPEPGVAAILLTAALPRLRRRHA